jgi:ribose transport system substrate-binding protein
MSDSLSLSPLDKPTSARRAFLSRRQWLAASAALPFLLPGCERDPGLLRIVVIPKGMTHEFWLSIHRGAERAADDFKVEGTRVQIIWDGPLRERDILEQIAIVDRRIATGVNGIVLAPQHSRIMSAPVKRAQEENIPVVVIDSGLADEAGMIKYVATDNYNGGWLAAEHLARTLGAEGKTEPKLILLRYQVGSESTERREQGFLDYFDPDKRDRPRHGPLPTVRWLSDNQYAGATRDSASRAAGPLVQQFKDQADAIFAPNESSASGTLDVLRSQELNFGDPKNKRRIHLMGFDSSKPLLQAIADGDVDGSIIQDPYKMGYVGVTVLVRFIQGEDVNEHRTQMTQSTGEYLVTRANVHDPETVKRFDPAEQAKRNMREELVMTATS